MRTRLLRFLSWISFNLWYLRRPPWDTGISPPELLDFIRSHPPGKALDLGCGTGTNVVSLARHGWRTTGIDFAAPAIARAQARARSASFEIDLRVGDVTDLHDLGGTFDLILDIGCFHSLDPAGRVAYQRNLHRLLSPGGYLLMYAFYKADSSQAGTGLTQDDLDDFASFLHLVRRSDGMDRGRHPSIWLTWRL